MVLANGMTLYLDDGKPAPGKFERTLENARQVSISLSFDVPVAHGLKVAAMQDDAELRHAYFGDLDIFFTLAPRCLQMFGRMLNGWPWRNVAKRR